jgi:hypothetical protein
MPGKYKGCSQQLQDLANFLDGYDNLSEEFKTKVCLLAERCMKGAYDRGRAVGDGEIKVGLSDRYE